MAHIVLSDIEKSFHSDRGVTHAVARVNFEVEEASFLSIVGPSGCGKSTLLSLVAGLEEPSEGTITIAGQPVDGPTGDIGMVFQDHHLLPWRTVLGNVMFPVEILGLPQKEYRAKAEDLLALVNLSKFAGHYPRELSGGMRQRVAICRGLIHNPAILLMDEPFSALDALTRDEMNLELQRIWETYRKTILFVTHSIREAVLLSDRVIVMSPHPGRIVDDLRIRLPRPRGLEVEGTEEFTDYCRVLRAAISAGHPGGDGEDAGIDGRKIGNAASG